MVLRTIEIPQFHFDKVIDVPDLQVVRAPQVRRGGESRAPTVALVEKLDELKWGFFRALYTGTGPGAVSTGTRYPIIRCMRRLSWINMVVIHLVRTTTTTTPHDVANLPGKCLFISLYIFLKQLYSFYEGMVSYFSVLLSMLVAEREPTPCYRDAYSVDTPKWAYREKGWQNHCKTTFSPLFGRFFFWLAKGPFSFSGGL